MSREELLIDPKFQLTEEERKWNSMSAPNLESRLGELWIIHQGLQLSQKEKPGFSVDNAVKDLLIDKAENEITQLTFFLARRN